MFNNVTFNRLPRLGCRIPRDPQQFNFDGPLTRDQTYLEKSADRRTRIADHLAQMRRFLPDSRVRGGSDQGDPPSDRWRNPDA